MQVTLISLFIIIKHRRIRCWQTSKFSSMIMIMSIINTGTDINTNIMQRFEGHGSETNPPPENEV